jgi:hypothetical protein
MFSIIYCLLPIVFVFFQISILKKRNSLSWEIKKGKICYNCKEDLNLSEKETFERLMKSEDYSKICIPCSRDRKISLLQHPYLIIKYKFQKFVVTQKFDKLNKYFLISVCFFIILDIVFKLFGMNISLYLVYGSINIIYWCISIYRTIYMSNKKPSEN